VANNKKNSSFIVMSGFRRFLMLLNTDPIPECKIIDLHSFLIELKKRLIQKTAFTGLACCCTPALLY
jgi:hypothetical protein